MPLRRCIRTSENLRVLTDRPPSAHRSESGHKKVKSASELLPPPDCCDSPACEKPVGMRESLLAIGGIYLLAIWGPSAVSSVKRHYYIQIWMRCSGAMETGMMWARTVSTETTTPALTDKTRS